MNPFQPSPFWRVFAKLWSLRFLMAAAIIALCFELVARVSPFLVGKQVHQRYLYEARISQVDDTTRGKEIHWAANDRGARGELYRGQATQIAVFGSSTSEDWALDQSQSWAQQLMLNLGSDTHHVDNYARNDAYHNEAIAILKEFARIGRHYDIVLLMMSVTPFDSYSIDPRSHPESLATGFLYWGHWDRAHSRPIAAWKLLLRRLEMQVRSEERLRNFRNWSKRLFSPPRPASPHPRRNDRANRTLRKDGKVQLKYVLPPFAEEDRKLLAETTRRLLEAAQSAADHVYLLTQPVAYDANEHPGVWEKWFSLYPIEGEIAYHDNRSVAEAIRRKNAVMVEAAESVGVRVIDVDAHMRPLLAERGDLFFDKWHFSTAGAELAADFIADTLVRDGVAGARR